METGGQYNIYARFVTGDGSPAGVHHLDPYVVHQQHPDVACSGSQYLVTWEEQYSNMSGPYGVWGRLMATDATMQRAGGAGGPDRGHRRRVFPPRRGRRTQPGRAWEHDRANTESGYSCANGDAACDFLAGWRCREGQITSEV
ncbi:MAG: hypothetical protein R2838_05115 [Caldilineaceae bacterium]